jgi:hypothetical protein
MAKHQYGQIFERFGIPGMGHQGTTWCSVNPEEVLVLMAHQNYFHKRTGKWQYEMPPDEPATLRGPSAKRSLDMIAAYFESGKRKIILPVAVFVTDGELRADGTWGPSVFDHATGDFYEGSITAFERHTGYLLCEIEARRSV